MNARFSTYASYWIKQSIQHALVCTAKAIRLPYYIHTLLAKWRRQVAQLHVERGCAPTESEVAQSLGLSSKSLKIVQKATRADRALQEVVSSSGEEKSIMEILPDTNAQSAEAVSSRKEELDEVRRLLDRLAERSAVVLRLRFGLGGEEQKTLQEVAGHLGLTRERVRQIERDALLQLREAMLAG